MSQTTSYNFESSFDDNIQPLEEINGEEDAETYIQRLYETVVENQKDSQADEIIAITSHKPDVVILHLRTNDAPNKTSNAIVDNILSLKHAVEKALPYCKVILSSLTPRLDNGKANLTNQTFQRSS